MKNNQTFKKNGNICILLQNGQPSHKTQDCLAFQELMIFVKNYVYILLFKEVLKHKQMEFIQNLACLPIQSLSDFHFSLFQFHISYHIKLPKWFNSPLWVYRHLVGDQYQREFSDPFVEKSSAGFMAPYTSPSAYNGPFESLRLRSPNWGNSWMLYLKQYWHTSVTLIKSCWESVGLVAYQPYFI